MPASPRSGSRRAGHSPGVTDTIGDVAIRNVIFDFYGTLARAAHPTPSLTELLSMLGVDVTPEVADRWHVERLDGVVHAEASASRETYEEWEEDRWRRMLADCGVTCKHAANLMNAIRVQVRGFHVASYPEAGAVLEELRSRGLRVGVCSNWHWDLDPYLQQAEISGLVELAVTSARVGARKDHPLIYSRTLEAMDAVSAESVFVGDSWRPDVIGPLANGFVRAVHIDRGRGAQDDLPPGAIRVADLSGVLSIV